MAQGSVVSEERVLGQSGFVSSTLHPPTSSHRIPTTDLNAILEEMQKQLLTLNQERIALQKRIAMVRQTIEGLVIVFGRSAISEDLLDMLTDSRRKEREPGLTRTCRRLLTEASRALTVVELLAVIQDKHPTLLEHNNNPRASLTSVLTRLAKYGTAEEVSNERGARAWKSTIPLAPAEPSPFGTEVEATKTIQTALGTERIVVGSHPPATSELARACRIALMESREVAPPEEIYARIVRRASFSFDGMGQPLVAIAEALEALSEESRDQNPG